MPFEELVDDREAIPDDVVLYRRVDWDKIGGKGKYAPGEVGRLNKNCFTDQGAEVAAEHGLPGPCMSVAAGNHLPDDYPPERLLDSWPGYGLASFTARDVRNLSRADGSPCPQGVMLAPTEAEPWHAVVFDLADPDAKRSGGACRAIAERAEWVVPLRRED